VSPLYADVRVLPCVKRTHYITLIRKNAVFEHFLKSSTLGLATEMIIHKSVLLQCSVCVNRAMEMLLQGGVF